MPDAIPDIIATKERNRLPGPHPDTLERFRKMCLVGVPMGMLVHLLYIAVFWYLDIPFMVVFNLVSTVLFALATFATMRNWLWTTTLIAGLEMPLHAIAATVFVGVDTGFWLPLITLLLVTCVVPMFTAIQRTLALGLYALIALSLPLVSYFYPLLAPQPQETVTALLVMNIATMLPTAISMMIMFLVLLSRAERNFRTLSENLSETVDQQVGELERTRRLRRFLSPQIASMVESDGDGSALQSHRAEITVLFCDLRGFTSFADKSLPDKVMETLNAYHQMAGPRINSHEGTLDRFAGDGIIVFFNDPIPCPDPGLRAVRLADDLHRGFAEAVRPLAGTDHELGFSVGIAQGPATLGPVGFEDRFDYTAIGSVTNLAARLCDRAADGQTLISREIANSVRGYFDTHPVDAMQIKGFDEPISVHELHHDITASG